jgi:hypothetical protein
MCKKTYHHNLNQGKASERPLSTIDSVLDHPPTYNSIVLSYPYFPRFLIQAVVPFFRVVYPIGQSPLGLARYLELAARGLHIHKAQRPPPPRWGSICAILEALKRALQVLLSFVLFLCFSWKGGRLLYW